MELYSIKMRAAQAQEHISGAEKIVDAAALDEYCSLLLRRAMTHGKGTPDFINIKIEAVREQDLLVLPALPVRTIQTATPEEGLRTAAEHLRRLGIARTDDILGVWLQAYGMRGAVLLDCDTLRRLEPDPARGIRATYMDSITPDGAPHDACATKNHFAEALVLATKVVHHPNIIAELCISDDPDYVTGYVAAREFGYVRITTLKPLGSPRGGRVFLFRGSEADRDDCIRYMEQQRVLVRLDGTTP